MPRATLAMLLTLVYAAAGAFLPQHSARSLAARAPLTRVEQPAQMFLSVLLGRRERQKELKEKQEPAAANMRECVWSPSAASYVCAHPADDTCVLCNDIPGFEGQEVWVCSAAPPDDEYLGTYWEEMMS